MSKANKMAVDKANIIANRAMDAARAVAAGGGQEMEEKAIEFAPNVVPRGSVGSHKSGGSVRSVQVKEAPKASN